MKKCLSQILCLVPQTDQNTRKQSSSKSILFEKSISIEFLLSFKKTLGKYQRQFFLSGIKVPNRKLITFMSLSCQRLVSQKILFTKSWISKILETFIYNTHSLNLRSEIHLKRQTYLQRAQSTTSCYKTIVLEVPNTRKKRLGAGKVRSLLTSLSKSHDF